jgi:hypothetical protein
LETWIISVSWCDCKLFAQMMVSRLGLVLDVEWKEDFVLQIERGLQSNGLRAHTRVHAYFFVGGIVDVKRYLSVIA